MDADPPLEHLLSVAGGPAAGRDELQAIVARSGRRRTRIAAFGMIAALAAGTVAGWSANPGRSSVSTGLAAGVTTTAAVAVASPAIPAAPGPNLTRKFVRTTADGVTIRGYQPDAVKGVPEPCRIPPFFQAEVSTSDIAGVAGSFVSTSGAAPFTAITAMMIGVVENAPVWVVTVNTAPGVAQVRVTFTDGQADQMAPAGGWSVLAHVVPAPFIAKVPARATVEALDASGKVLATQSADQSPSGKTVVPAPAPDRSIAGGGKTSSTPPVPSTLLGHPAASPPVPVLPRPLPLPCGAPGAKAGASGAATTAPVIGGTAATTAR